MFLENRFIFLPEKHVLETPGDRDLAFEDVSFQSSDRVKLHGWFLPGEREITFLWLHGNAGNIGHRLDIIQLWHTRLKGNIFIFDYRGYGRSGGRVSEEGTYLDARAALAYLLSRPDVDPQRIIYSGHSLGSAIAVDLALYHRPLGLILESPFTSIKDMAKMAFPLLPIYLLLNTKYDSLSKIGKVSCPLLILRGEQDELIPPSHSKKLFEAAKEPKRLITLPGAGHNNLHLVAPDLYFSAIGGFVESLPADEAKG